MLVDKALAVEEGEQHLFGPASLDLSLYWTQLTPLLYPLLGLLFCLRSAVTHHHLVHGDNGVQHGERVAWTAATNSEQTSITLLLLVVIQKFGHPSC